MQNTAFKTIHFGYTVHIYSNVLAWHCFRLCMCLHMLASVSVSKCGVGFPPLPRASVSVTRTIRDTLVMMLPCSGEVDLGDRIDGSTISQDFTARVGRGRGCKTVEMFLKKKPQYCFLMSMQRLFPVFPTSDGATVEIFFEVS